MVQTAKARDLSSRTDDFVSTALGTRAGTYLRRFWNPVYHATDLKVGRPVPLRIMSENYTLYRGEGGDVFLVQARCPHRGAQLSAGSVEGNALRCFYHGWKFDGDGRCLEQPADESRFCERVSIATWPTREYLGLIFAYLGEDNLSELPLYPEFERFVGLLEIDSYLRRCNYFQNIDNALDMSHVAFAHGNNRVSYDKIGLGRSLQAEVSKEAEVHQKNLDAIKEACRLIRDKCIVPRSLAEDRRYAADVDRLSTELARQREERKILQSQIDELVKTDHSDVAGLDQKVRIAERTVTEAGKSLRSARDGNQIYRLVASWYGVSTSDVTEEQFATGRWVFATFSAVAVALAGSIAALVYYARNRIPGAPSFLGNFVVKLLNARRRYFARKRKPLKVEVPGPERVIYRDGKEPPLVVEKFVDRLIDHIVLIPRWGIWNPTYINSLIRSGKRNVAEHDDPADGTSNVTQLKKKVN